MFGSLQCSRCSHKLDRNARYCPNCGTPQGTHNVVCGNCRKGVPTNATFCPHCGQTLTAAAAPFLRENRWSRPNNALAVRVEVDDVKGFWSHKLIIEPGTQAIIMADGRNLGVQGPGSYTLENLISKAEKFSYLRMADQMTAVVVDTEPFELEFTLEDIFTQDPLRVGFRVRLMVQVSDPLAFYMTMVRSQIRFSRDDLRNFLAPEIDNVAQEWIGERTVADLAVRQELKRELEEYLEMSLSRTFALHGLMLNQLRTLDYSMKHQDRIRGIEEKYILVVTEMDTELAGRQRLFDVMNRTELQKLAEEVQKVARYEQQIKIRERMRRAVLSDEFGQLQTTQERERFLRAFDKQKLLDADEWARFQRTLTWRQDDELRERREALADKDWARNITLEDRQRDRAHLIARIELENRFSQEKLKLAQRQDLEPAQLAHEQGLAQQRLEGERALETTRQEFRLSLQERESEFRRRQQKLDDLSQREKALHDTQNQLTIALQQAQNEAEIARLEREQDQADAELGILLLEKMKAVRRRDDEERELIRLRVKRQEMEIDLDNEQRRLHLRIQADEAIFGREIKKQELTHQQEMEWLGQLRGMAPAELIVAARDTEKAKLVHALQETEAMKGMGEQQILAMMAGNSPAAAQALVEIARAAADGTMGQEQRAMYERILLQAQQLADQRGAETDRLERMQRDQADRMERIMGRALDTQRDASIEIARATNHGQVSPTVVVAGAGGYPATVVGPSALTAQTMRCPKCSEVVAGDANFCPNCQHQLRGKE